MLATRLGLEIFRSLAAYVGVVLLGLALQQFVVYSASVAWLGGMSPLRFFRGVRTAMLTAFSTASSNATLPTALWVAEHELRLPSHVSRFVLTLGSTANQNGTALFEGVTVLFLAQLYGVELTLAQQTTVAFICVLGGIGTAGVPAGSIPVIAMILGMVGVPAGGHRRGARRRPLPRHVPHGRERDGRPGGGGGGVARANQVLLERATPRC